ncbi:MAG: serine/threonine protein kinase [Polyangiaceae bacterium]|nr:serine/threonine protein kinase [Polyangiaceae bacterium]
MARVSIIIGDVIGSRYCIEAVLGQGGMAIVYQARNTGTGKACALKIVHPHLVARPELVEMFVREAQVAGRIGESPYVVNVFDAGVDDRLGVPFMAMELLKGETLDQYVEQHGPMPRSMVRTLFDQLADALDQAHRAGVIHRDLKPSNLFITHDRRGRPILKIMDFGIAKVLEHGPQRTATRIGSPAYAAPEQQASAAFRRLAAKHGVIIAQGVTPATDVWAMGLVAYELLTGLPKGQYWATLESLDDILIKVAMEENESATERAGDRAYLLPPGFDDWFATCLKKNAAERWQTPGEASAALRRLLAPTDIEVESTQPLSDAYPIIPVIPPRKLEASPPAPSPAAPEPEAGRKKKKRLAASPLARSADLAGPESDTEPDGSSALPDHAFTPVLRTRPSHIAKSQVLPPPPPPALEDENEDERTSDAGDHPEDLRDNKSPAAVQTRGTWTRTHAWPRRSKVALVIGASSFVAVLLIFLLQPKPLPLINPGAPPPPSASSLGIESLLQAVPSGAPSEPPPTAASSSAPIAVAEPAPSASATSEPEKRSKRRKKWVPVRIPDAGPPDGALVDTAPLPTKPKTEPPFEAPAE